MGLVNWLKNIFRDEGEEFLKTNRISPINGRARCVHCNKKLHDDIYKLAGNYYCKKHAVSYLRDNLVGDENEKREKVVKYEDYDYELKSKNEKNSKSPIVNYPKKCGVCKLKLTIIDRFLCKYCGGAFCNAHRLPEDHNCSGNPKNPHKFSGRFIYSKGKTFVSSK